jgi:hypothetical protein
LFECRRVPPLTYAVLVSLGFVRAEVGTLLSIGSIAATVPTFCGCGAIPGERSVTRAAVPEARAAIAGAIVRVPGARTMFPGGEISQAGAEILHFAREFIEAPLKFGIVRCWGYASVEVEMASMMRSAQRAAVFNSISSIPARATWTLDGSRLAQIKRSKRFGTSDSRC